MNEVALLLCPDVASTLETGLKMRLPKVDPKDAFSKFEAKLPNEWSSLYVMVAAVLLITADSATAEASSKTAAQSCNICRLMILTPVWKIATYEAPLKDLYSGFTPLAGA